MAKAYICDACGKVIQSPHTLGLKEFTLGPDIFDCNSDHVYRALVQNECQVDICPNCYHALVLISEGAKMPEQPKPPASQTIKIKYLSDEIEKLDYISGKSDWIDLRAAETVEMKKGEYKLIPLGIAMQLPAGYEAHIVPRSSTFKNFKVLQTNHMGVVDESYCGPDDQWYFPALAVEDTVIHVNDRICQFRIMEHQPQLTFDAVNALGNTSRGGFGTTGKQ